MSTKRMVAVMGLLATLLAACGLGGSDEPQAPKVAAGEAGLEQVRVEATDLLRDLTTQITGATDLTVDSATGRYQSSGNAGTSYYEYTAEANLTGDSTDLDPVAKVMRDAGLDASISEGPDGDPTVQGRGGGIDAALFVDPADGTARLQVTRGGATIESDPVKFPAERRAELREETPIDLG